MKLWGTGVAAAQSKLHGCVACIVHVPCPASVTVYRDTVQTVTVRELKLTGRPELALALIANGGAPNALFASTPKVTVWLPFVIWKLWVTGEAAE
jgi:hypothetical protein